ncbi:MAG: hypothetical protein AB7P02_25305, partial [Alphaproteobacteria bacterium]
MAINVGSDDGDFAVPVEGYWIARRREKTPPSAGGGAAEIGPNENGPAEAAGPFVRVGSLPVRRRRSS